MKKILFFVLSIVAISSCNQNGKGIVQLSPVEQRAKTDTVIGFGNHLLGDTVGTEYEIQTISTKHRDIECGVMYSLKDGKELSPVIDEITVMMSLDKLVHPRDIIDIVELYTERYGEASYIQQNGTGIIGRESNDSLVNKKIEQFPNSYRYLFSPNEYKLVWEWNNCKIRIYYSEPALSHYQLNIEYSSDGHKDRIERENTLTEKFKTQRI